MNVFSEELCPEGGRPIIYSVERSQNTGNVCRWTATLKDSTFIITQSPLLINLFISCSCVNFFISLFFKCYYILQSTLYCISCSSNFHYWRYKLCNLYAVFKNQTAKMCLNIDVLNVKTVPRALKPS